MTRQKFLKQSTLLFLFLISLTVHTFGQHNAITEVRFEFWHSHRIPDHHVTIEMKRVQDSITAHLISTPASKSLKWDSTKRDYSFHLTTTDFDKVIASVRLIDASDIVSYSDFSGFDGTTCNIEFGGYGATIKYSVWSPDFETKERRLQTFLDACTLLLQTAKFDSKKIFE